MCHMMLADAGEQHAIPTNSNCSKNPRTQAFENLFSIHICHIYNEEEDTLLRRILGHCSIHSCHIYIMRRRIHF